MTAMSAEAPTNAEQAPAELASPAPPRGLTVLVCGDRAWSDGSLILRTLQSVPGVSRVIHGGCRGADLLGGWAARRLGIAVEVYPADWEREGRAAGPLRNARMLAQGQPQLVLAFHDRLSESRGTRDMLVRAGAARVPIRVVSHARPEGTGSLAPGPARRESPSDTVLPWTGQLPPALGLAKLDGLAGRRVEVPADSPQPPVAPVRVVHCKRARFDVYIGRPGPWGNPFILGKDGYREEVIAKFASFLASRPDLVARARLELAGRVLGCWCAPLACHGDVLARVAQGGDP